MTTISVSNAAQLTSALSAARSGDTISLAGGDYGDFTIRSKLFASDVTITSKSDAALANFHSLTILDSAHIHVDDVSIKFTPTMSTYSFSPALQISGSHDIAVTRGAITGGNAINGVAPSATALDSSGNVQGLPAGYGVSIQHSSGVKVDGVDIGHFAKGVVLGASDNITISHDEIHDLRTSGIVGSGLNHVTIDSNHIHDSTPWRWGQTPIGDHGDFIAFWTDKTASTDINVTNNLMEQGKGTAILGMWLQGSAALPFTNSVIEGNTILNGNFQGISLWGADGTKIDHNTLLQTSGDVKSGPSILLATNSVHNQVYDNITGAVNDVSGSKGASANIIGINSLVQKFDIKAAGYYTDDLVNSVASTHDYTTAYNAATTDLAQAKATVAAQAVAATTAVNAAAQSAVAGQTVNGLLLVGTAKADVLTGTAGSDTLSGGKGDDILTGGKGADTFRFEYAGGHDTITDFGANHEHDVLDLSSFYNAHMRAIVHDVAGGVSIGFSSGDTIMLTGLHASDLIATSSGFTI